ncbi:hypothetical protein GCM10020219_034480 [Nonomuraea dietziae]
MGTPSGWTARSSGCCQGPFTTSACSPSSGVTGSGCSGPWDSTRWRPTCPGTSTSPRKGEFQRLEELAAFLDAAAAEGLLAIVRPGPYICAEWDNGGLPSWLTAELGLRVRTRDAEYLSHVERFFDEVVPLIAERQVTKAATSSWCRSRTSTAPTAATRSTCAT